MLVRRECPLRNVLVESVSVGIVPFGPGALAAAAAALLAWASFLLEGAPAMCELDSLTGRACRTGSQCGTSSPCSVAWPLDMFREESLDSLRDASIDWANLLTLHASSSLPAVLLMLKEAINNEERNANGRNATKTL